MDRATERRIVYVLCLAGLAFGLFDLYLGQNAKNLQAIGVSVLIIGLSIATGIAVWRSGRAESEVPTGIETEIDGE
jgi:TM2 domain-containing membrane protein YozV